MTKLESYVEGRWQAGSADGREYRNPATGEMLGRVDATGVDCGAALAFARSEGGAALSALNFGERGALLRAVSDVLTANRDKYVDIARQNSGNTALDAAIDIDGGIGTLKYYSFFGKSLGDGRFITEAGSDQLAKEDVFRSGHVWTSRRGAAVHINAYNFPSWGLWEKAAVALLAGMPVVAKPASATAWLSHEMVRDVIAADILPAGALSLICGSGEGLMDGLDPFDSVAFTGSADTGAMLRGHPRMLAAAPRFNVEADSVNATILGADAQPGDPVFDLLVREAVKALSVKAGQLCTNIRRIIVPQDRLDAVAEAVTADLGKISVGDPADESVRMGPLVNKTQQQAAFDGLAALSAEGSVLTGGGVPDDLQGGDADRGAFLAPTLLRCDDPDSAKAVHEIEVFGPAATLIPYRDSDHAVDLAHRGGGSLAVSLFSDDIDLCAETAAAVAPSHGRVLVVDSTVGKNHTGHSIVMPQCVHGGPGRAGGGEELGGLRGLRFYMQRTAIQGSPALHEKLGENATEAAF